jgi:hypothetical protein
MWIVWFQLVILSIVVLFTIVMWDWSSYIDLLMFYSLACLSFFRYRSYGFRSLSMYFPIDYYRFRNYRNIGAVFVFDNIVSISFSRKRCENESDLASYRSFPIVFIPRHDPVWNVLIRHFLWNGLVHYHWQCLAEPCDDGRCGSMLGTKWHFQLRIYLTPQTKHVLSIYQHYFTNK